MIKNILIDFKRTLYNPDTKMLIEGALSGLELFQKEGLHVRLVGKGSPEEIRSIIDDFGIGSYFGEICIDDDKEKFFEGISVPDEWLVIGDRALKEIRYGGERGMHTIWFKNGKFSTEEPEAGQKQPEYTVQSWDEILRIVRFDILGR